MEPEAREELTSIFGARTAEMMLHGPAGLAIYVVEVLKYVGNADTVEPLQSFVDDPALGACVIETIRALAT